MDDYADKVVNEAIKKRNASQKKVRKKLGVKNLNKFVNDIMPSEQMQKNNPKGAEKTVKEKLKKKVGPKLLKEVQDNSAKANRDARIAYEYTDPDVFGDKDPRMEAGKFRQFGSSRVPKKGPFEIKKAKGGTVRLASGGPVVDSYDYD